MVGSPPLIALASFAACFFGQLLEVAQSQSQNKTQTRTDTAEVVPLSLSISLRVVLQPFFVYNIIMKF